VTQDGLGAPPNCVYLIRAEERFGNGDHVFTLAEQTRAVAALYQVSRGLQAFTGTRLAGTDRDGGAVLEGTRRCRRQTAIGHQRRLPGQPRICACTGRPTADSR
jgi:hypothetical protein